MNARQRKRKKKFATPPLFSVSWLPNQSLKVKKKIYHFPSFFRISQAGLIDLLPQPSILAPMRE